MNVYFSDVAWLFIVCCCYNNSARNNGRSAFTERQELELERQNAIFTVHFDRRFYRLGSSINYIRTVLTDPV